MSAPRLSHSAALILKGISLGYRYGFDIIELTGLPSATVYTALRRMERDGLVLSGWESETGPARRFYEITREGNATALAATERYPLLARLQSEKHT